MGVRFYGNFQCRVLFSPATHGIFQYCGQITVLACCSAAAIMPPYHRWFCSVAKDMQNPDLTVLVF